MRCSEAAEWHGERDGERRGVYPAGGNNRETRAPVVEGASGTGDAARNGSLEPAAARGPMWQAGPADAPVRVTALALLGLFALGLIAAVGSRAEPALPRGEVVLFRGRPRRGLLHYVSSLGLSELTRKTTFFAVTTRRVVVDRGLLVRNTHSIPTAGIVGVEVVAGPWEGTVHVSGRGGSSFEHVAIGPLRAPAARALASTIATYAGR